MEPKSNFMRVITAISVFILFFTTSKAQEATRFVSASGEINFSSARIVTESGTEGGNVLRFAPWFNIQMYNNIDYKNHGYFMGFTVRNIGFIYKKDNEKWIARNYALGIPLGLKWGNMKGGNFLYLGYEFEMPINYRERYYRNDSKERVFNIWFSDRVTQFTHAGFLGFNFRSGFNVKFKYYFTEFLNSSFNNASIDDDRDLRYPGNGLDPSDPNYIAPRDFLKVNVAYISVTWNMFRKPYYYTHIEKKEKAESVY